MVELLNLTLLSDDFVALPQRHREYEAFPGGRAEPDFVLDGGDTETAFPPRPQFTSLGSFAEPTCFDVYVRSEVYNLPIAWVMFAGPDFTATELGRRRFAVKAARVLQRGASLVLINPVCDPPADLHNDVVKLIHPSFESEWKSPTGMAATVYRITREKGQDRLAIWTYPLAIGAELPTVPLWLERGLAVPLDLESTCAGACKGLRVR